MHSFTTAEIGSSADMMGRLLARQAVDDAIAALNAAGATLIGLTADTQWQSDGVRTLRNKLEQFESAAGVEVGRLSSRSWELEQAVFS